MARRTHVASVIATGVALGLLTAAAAGSQTAVAAAREAYANAEYERCVSLLESAVIPEEEAVAAAEYRALCLVALDREPDAVKSIEAILRARPTYKVAPEASPRLRALVTRVKQSALPPLVRERYVTAKKAYDEKKHNEAAEGFRVVLAMLDDPALEGEALASLDGLKTVASGFLELIAATPPPAPPPAPAPPLKQAPRVYGITEPGIKIPETIDQTLPPWIVDPAMIRAGIVLRGTVEVIIDETGGVESARVIDRMNPDYDARVLRAARTWKYQPARLADGTAVKFRKLIEIKLSPSSSLTAPHVPPPSHD